MNKKGSMFPRNMLYVLGTLFGIGIILMLVINPVIDGYIKPGLLNAATESVQEQISNPISNIITYLKMLPYILFTISIIYLLVIIFRKEQVTQ